MFGVLWSSFMCAREIGSFIIDTINIIGRNCITKVLLKIMFITNMLFMLPKYERLKC